MHRNSLSSLGLDAACQNAWLLYKSVSHKKQHILSVSSMYCSNNFECAWNACRGVGDAWYILKKVYGEVSKAKMGIKSMTVTDVGTGSVQIELVRNVVS